MHAELRKDMVIVRSPDDAHDALADWLTANAGCVFRLRGRHGVVTLHAMGPEAEVCREPLNITSRTPGALRLISNFANTPFELDGVSYAGIEGFWQGLKFPDSADRLRLAGLYGSAAKDAGFHAPPHEEFNYGGRRVRVGTWDHWQLMRRACRAKFSQHDEARAALLSTGSRPLVHEVKPDSKNIPGVIMAQIWMEVREKERRSKATGT